jgi:DUF971 family protein
VPQVVALKAHRGSRRLDVRFDDGREAQLSFEYLRVYSPSAELWGHGRREPQLVGGKQAVGLQRVERVGHYAVRLVFDDGHDSGLYSWDVLDRLARDHDRLWPRYLERLAAAGMRRDRDVMTLRALRPE